MHLTFAKLALDNPDGGNEYRFKVGADLDAKFFYSVPTCFFVLDARIHSVLRQLMAEAEGCLKSNFLTGASACARKIVYELARIERAPGASYEERLKTLKAIRTDVDGDYFDTLLTIQQVTSEKVHEESYDGWSATHLRLILSTLKEILTVMYVLPEIRKEKRNSIVRMKNEILGTGAASIPAAKDTKRDNGHGAPN